MSTGHADGNAIRVFIVDDQSLILSALESLLTLEGDIDVVGTATDAHDLTHRIADSQADVALIDIEMPGIDGIQATTDLTGHSHCHVIIVTTFGRPGYLQRALDAGARGFVVKDSPVETLTSAIRDVFAGKTIIPLQLHDKVRATGDKRSAPRSQQVPSSTMYGSG